MTTGLPANLWFLAQVLPPRTDAILNATVAAMTSVSSGQSLLGRDADVAPGHKGVAGVDKSRVPLVINAT